VEKKEENGIASSLISITECQAVTLSLLLFDWSCDASVTFEVDRDAVYA